MHVTTRRRLRRRQRWNHAELALINLNARIVLCGMISQYSATAPVPGPANLANILFKRTQMEGFICIDHMDRADAATAELRRSQQHRLMVVAPTTI